jgi:hypothetical protein
MAPGIPITARGYHGTTMDAAEKILAQKNFEREDRDWHWLGCGIYFWQDAPLRAWQWAERKAKELTRDGSKAEPAVVSANIELGCCLDMLDVGSWPLIDIAWKKVSEQFEADGKAVPRQVGPVEAFSCAAVSKAISHCKANNHTLTIPMNVLAIFMPEAYEEIERFYSKEGVVIPECAAIPDLEEQIARRYGNNKRDCAVVNWVIQFLKNKGIPLQTARAAFMEGNEPYQGSWFRDSSHVQIAVVDPLSIRTVVSDIKREDNERLREEHRRTQALARY